MSNTPVIPRYVVAITKPETAVGETPIYRCPESVNGLLDHIPRLPHVRTLQDLHDYTSKSYADLNCLGTRIKKEDGTLGQYVWKTYGTVYNNARKIGSALLNLDLAPIVQEKGYQPCRLVAIYARNCEEWVTTDMACCLYGLTSIPIFDTLGQDSLPFIFEQTQVQTIFTSANHVDKLIQDAANKKTSKLRTIICIENFTSDQVAAAKKAGLQLLPFSYLLEKGQNILPYPPVSSDTLFSLCYTSGTTGTAKAAILTHGNIVAAVGACEESVAIGVDRIMKGDIHISYLPMAHIFERVWVQMILPRGVGIGFFGGDPQKLTEDMQLLKPSYLISVPRIYNKFYESFQNAINAALKKPLGTPIEDPINPAILEKLRGILGGKNKFFITGSAPISPEVHAFLRKVFGVPFFEGFGQTETCSACHAQHPNDPTLRSIGGVMRNTEFKLVDLPDMNYTAKDKGPNGEPMPRGELCLRGPSIFKGYYKEPEKTAETIDKDGWHHTGDVAALLPNGDLRLIDRKKNIFKLAQAEFVAPDKIENIYLTNKYVGEVYVYGDSFRSNLVGVVVPDPDNVMALGKELGIENTSFDNVCKDPRVASKVLEEMNKTGKAAKLVGYEMVKEIYLEPQSFVLLGLTTPSMKLRRDVAKAHFKEIIEKLYAPKAKL